MLQSNTSVPPPRLQRTALLFAMCIWCHDGMQHSQTPCQVILCLATEKQGHDFCARGTLQCFATSFWCSTPDTVADISWWRIHISSCESWKASVSVSLVYAQPVRRQATQSDALLIVYDILGPEKLLVVGLNTYFVTHLDLGAIPKLINDCWFSEVAGLSLITLIKPYLDACWLTVLLMQANHLCLCASKHCVSPSMLKGINELVEIVVQHGNQTQQLEASWQSCTAC